MRRPSGDHGVGLAPRWASRGEAFPVGLQRVDAQIERRPARRRQHDTVIAEYFCKVRIEPLRIIADDVHKARRPPSAVSARRSVALNGSGEKASAIATRRSPRRPCRALAPSMPSRRPRGVSSSMIQALEARRRSVSQINPESRRDRRTGIAVRGAPSTGRFRGRNALGIDRCNDFNGGGQPGGRCHSRTFGWRKVFFLSMIFSKTGSRIMLQISNNIFSAK